MTTYYAATAVGWLALALLLLAVAHRTAVTRERIDQQAEAAETVAWLRGMKTDTSSERGDVA